MVTNFYYKSENEPETLFLLQTEGPSTFLALHLASLEYKINDVDHDFDSLVNRFPFPSEQAWEPFRSNYLRFWPDRRKRLEKEIIDQVNGSTGGRGHKKTDSEASHQEAFDSSLHEAKPIWKIWLEIRKAYPGDRITDWDFLLFEATVNGGVDPGYILTQVNAYVEAKVDGFGGYNFERFIRDGVYKGTFLTGKTRQSHLGRANNEGKDEVLSKRLGCDNDS